MNACAPEQHVGLCVGHPADAEHVAQVRLAEVVEEASVRRLARVGRRRRKDWNVCALRLVCHVSTIMRGVTIVFAIQSDNDVHWLPWSTYTIQNTSYNARHYSV
jgi:hypothetical protein